jgi:hypothetical protein
MARRQSVWTAGSRLRRTTPNVPCTSTRPLEGWRCSDPPMSIGDRMEAILRPALWRACLSCGRLVAGSPRCPGWTRTQRRTYPHRPKFLGVLFGTPSVRWVRVGVPSGARPMTATDHLCNGRRAHGAPEADAPAGRADVASPPDATADLEHLRVVAHEPLGHGLTGRSLGWRIRNGRHDSRREHPGLVRAPARGRPQPARGSGRRRRPGT